MSTTRIALANLPFPSGPEDSVRRVLDAVGAASAARADVVCFPECYVPGYRMPGKPVPPIDQPFLERAWAVIAAEAARHGLAVVLGTERVVDGRARITALVIGSDGRVAGFQDKVQLDPSEESGWSRARSGGSSRPGT